MNYEFLILYGSQTGTAKFAAEELGRELSKYDFKMNIMSLEDYDFLNLPEEPMVVFIVATTGIIN
jgi:sulfite reductase alpha subunit-like flavoprotein